MRRVKEGRFHFDTQDELDAPYGASVGNESKSGWEMNQNRFKDNKSLRAHNSCNMYGPD